jgi:hypothetical protein
MARRSLVGPFHFVLPDYLRKSRLKEPTMSTRGIIALIIALAAASLLFVGVVRFAVWPGRHHKERRQHYALN